MRVSCVTTEPPRSVLYCSNGLHEFYLVQEGHVYILLIPIRKLLCPYDILLILYSGYKTSKFSPLTFFFFSCGSIILDVRYDERKKIIKGKYTDWSVRRLNQSPSE